MTPRRLTPAVAGLVLVLTACGGSGGVGDDEPVAGAAPSEGAVDVTTPTDPSRSPAPTSGTASDASQGTVPDALDFTAPLVGGGDIELGRFAGRPVLLWFWAPW